MNWRVVRTNTGSLQPVGNIDELLPGEELATDRVFEHRSLALFWIDQERERVQEQKVTRLRAICLATICAAVFALVLL